MLKFHSPLPMYVMCWWASNEGWKQYNCMETQYQIIIPLTNPIYLYYATVLGHMYPRQLDTCMHDHKHTGSNKMVTGRNVGN